MEIAKSKFPKRVFVMPVNRVPTTNASEQTKAVQNNREKAMVEQALLEHKDPFWYMNDELK